MKKVSGNACAECVQFTQYYTVKCFHNFETADCGFCSLKNQIVKSAELCESFCKRKYKRMTAEEIDNAIAVVSDLKELL